MKRCYLNFYIEPVSQVIFQYLNTRKALDTKLSENHKVLGEKDIIKTQ